MAKKFGKFLFFTAAVGSAAAAVYYYMRKKDAENAILEDEDYDDFSEDLEDEDVEPSINYVPLTPDTNAFDEEKKDSFVPLDKMAQSVNATEDGAGDKPEAEVEEFFDEDDEDEDEPAINEDDEEPTVDDN